MLQFFFCWHCCCFMLLFGLGKKFPYDEMEMCCGFMEMNFYQMKPHAWKCNQPVCASIFKRSNNNNKSEFFPWKVRASLFCFSYQIMAVCQIKSDGTIFTHNGKQIRIHNESELQFIKMFMSVQFPFLINLLPFPFPLQHWYLIYIYCKKCASIATSFCAECVRASI